MIDPYYDLAQHYDLMKLDDPKRKQFFRQLFHKQGVKTVLDCACGTGYDLLAFHSLGMKVFGSDLSKSMLQQASKNIEASKAQIPLVQLDFRNLESEYKQKFDAVVCLSNSINELHHHSDVLQALNSMYSVIKDGGILVMDQGQTDASMQDPPRIVPIINDRDFSRAFVIDYLDEIMIVNILDFIHTETDSEFKRNRFYIKIRLQDDWQNLLSQIAFKKVDFYGDWEFTPYSKEDSKRLIIVAQR